VSRIVANARPFHFDDVGAQIGQKLRTDRPG
jgi:hypothetical protein